MKRIILGVTGSSPSKAAELAKRLTENGYAVDVILTGGAKTSKDFETATGRAVYAPPVGVVDEDVCLALSKDADLAVVAPATASAVARLAAGLADDPLTATLLALGDVPVLLCPAMDTATYRSPITQRNRRELDNLGYYFLGPQAAESGQARLAEIDKILERVGDMLDPECWGAYI